LISKRWKERGGRGKENEEAHDGKTDDALRIVGKDGIGRGRESRIVDSTEKKGASKSSAGSVIRRRWVEAYFERRAVSFELRTCWTMDRKRSLEKSETGTGFLSSKGEARSE